MGLAETLERHTRVAAEPHTLELLVLMVSGDERLESQRGRMVVYDVRMNRVCLGQLRIRLLLPLLPSSFPQRELGQRLSCCRWDGGSRH